ncbi:hypothetical protein ANO11243_049990 [Dothideomycetidae sp. 11243]|nr:hypothetical protein ANO11243_049990 [fungal sp. No.11243]
MVLLSFIAFTSALAGYAAAAVISATHAVHEKRGQFAAAHQWIKRQAVHPQAKVPVRVGLAQSNLDKAHDWLMDVSSPDSANYAKFWSSDDIIHAFQPSDEAVNAVRDWLVNTGGIDKARVTHSDNKAWLAFDATADEAEKLLHTKFHYYEHKNTGATYLACDEYHVPTAVQAHIDYITPGVKGVKVTPGEKTRGLRRGASHAPTHSKVDVNSLKTCDQAITPACIRALYSFKELPGNYDVCPSNALGVFEEGDYYAQEDLDLFFANYTLGSHKIPSGTHPTLHSIDGGEAPVPVAEAGGESDLDFELAYPIVYPQSITLFQTDDAYYASSQNTSNVTVSFDAPGSGFFNTFFDAIDGSYCTSCADGECGNDAIDPVYPDQHPGGYTGALQCGVFKPTNVLSVSYGEQERDLPVYYQQRQCTEFLKLGLQGVSIFFASGDDGVAGPPGDGSDNGCLGHDSTIFSPADPNSCPWLTNVGATKVYPGKTVKDPESAANDPAGQPYSEPFASGGGFSNIYPRPDYQKNAVAAYFANYNPPYAYYTNGSYTNGTFTPNTAGLYNRNGRGYPDVAAVGDNIATYNAGNWTLSGGTSASTPIFASLINRVVEERLRVGKGPVGFVNPVLYSHPYVLNDIKNGSNPGCGTNGFSAVPGWDPVTGLGTPNYQKMKQLWLSLP